MKTVKIKYAGFWDEFDPEDNFLTRLLRKHYNVEISEEPDYVICSCFEFYEYLDYPQVRIMYSGENYVPDFNYVDYALSLYPIDFLDRHYMFPGGVMSTFESFEALKDKNRNYSPEFLESKTCFANLIASHESEHGMRGELLKHLSQYKRVECAGTFKNNMPEGKTVSMLDGTKFELQRKCKFTLCPESIAHEGFVTEKIFDAFLADTIPIYFGSSTVSEVFNRRAYIDVRDFDSFDALLERIIELDTDDSKYLDMLNQPIFVRENYVEDSIKGMEEFLCHIFDQPLEKAYRRCSMYTPSRYEKNLKEAKRRGFSYAATQYFAVKDKFLFAKEKCHAFFHGRK